MCDTFITIRKQQEGYLFAKNSDREPEEGQSVVLLPRLKHAASHVPCTYISIPQVPETNAVILSKPFQMWGAEMGTNEHGLTIGNEAVFTKVKIARKNDGLTGMDLLRLALERCSTAPDAIRTITTLLKEYGQDACGGYKNKKFFYHNSFIIADDHEAWVLETAGREWAARKASNHASISNGLTISTDYDMISDGAISFAKKIGCYKEIAGKFSFAKSFSDWLYTYFSKCKVRQQSTNNASQKLQETYSVQEAMKALKQHNLADEQFHPKNASAASICMHATSMLNPSSTTGSMIVERVKGHTTAWVTATAYPCLSVYFPLKMGQPSVELEQLLDADPSNHASIWQTHQKLYQLVLKNYKKLKPKVTEALHEIQQIALDQYSPNTGSDNVLTESLLKLYKTKLTEVYYST